MQQIHMSEKHSLTYPGDVSMLQIAPGFVRPETVAYLPNVVVLEKITRSFPDVSIRNDRPYFLLTYKTASGQRTKRIDPYYWTEERRCFETKAVLIAEDDKERNVIKGEWEPHYLQSADSLEGRKQLEDVVNWIGFHMPLSSSNLGKRVRHPRDHHAATTAGR